ncbi:hypothetical protein COX05_04695 [candidate division WWE3 bacterium CG22_combo_CG10-13_8_21_14_all_39_12]|uniref:Uncharacterized protein n=1 Tax=candidate division WWE3 bacterium CG22_combo_CG10-13_8_21_14_all_39_12 TaxID=1975094 RepID=A0A2H0BEL4_UNCKA|nr:MAG: hypothetical protein COX05_04695 [candidate division WWE3 bacterium CG22_combo_CG10-13_8_21_14_all_39_12]
MSQTETYDRFSLLSAIVGVLAVILGLSFAYVATNMAGETLVLLPWQEIVKMTVISLFYAGIGLGIISLIINRKNDYLVFVTYMGMLTAPLSAGIGLLVCWLVSAFFPF